MVQVIFSFRLKINHIMSSNGCVFVLVPGVDAKRFSFCSDMPNHSSFSRSQAGATVP
jgi:hypothetical protein